MSTLTTKPNLSPKAPPAQPGETRLQLAIRRNEALLTQRMQRLALYGKAITAAFVGL